jgi:ribose transport system substrate-binding protein
MLIGFSTPVLANAVIQAMIRGLATTAAGRGGRVLVTDAALDVARQANDIDRLVAAGADALLVYPAGDPHTLRTSLDAAVDSGVPLFAHDDLGHPAVVGNLVTPVARMGSLAADLLAGLLGGIGTVAIVGGVPAPAIVDRLEGFRRRLAQRHRDLEVIAEVENLIDVEEGAEAVVAELLSRGTRPDGIFGYNDASAVGAARAAAIFGLRPVVVGNNAEPHGIEALADRQIAATIDRHPVELAVRGANVILDVLHGRVAPSEAQRIEIEPTPITFAEVGTFVPWDRRCPDPPPGSWEHI